MKAEVLAIEKMTNGMKSAGMDEAQAVAVVEAIAEGIQTFAVTRDVLREELAPVHERIDKLEEKFDRLDGKFDAKFDVLSGRIFYLMLTMIGAMVAMFGSMIAMLLT